MVSNMSSFLQTATLGIKSPIALNTNRRDSSNFLRYGTSMTIHSNNHANQRTMWVNGYGSALVSQSPKFSIGWIDKAVILTPAEFASILKAKQRQ